MAKPNYNFEKRQRELKKMQKQEEKRLKKQARTEPDSADTAAAPAGVAQDSAGEG